MFSGETTPTVLQESNTLALTVALQTVYQEEVQVSLNYNSADGTITATRGDEVVSVTKV